MDVNLILELFMHRGVIPLFKLMRSISLKPAIRAFSSVFGGMVEMARTSKAAAIPDAGCCNERSSSSIEYGASSIEVALPIQQLVEARAQYHSGWKIDAAS